MNADARIREVLKEHGEDFNTDSVWRVQGTPVISHKVLERIAARASIRFDMPTVLRSERDEAVILVVGSRDEMREWSIGEALVNVNYRVTGKQAAYVYAMAEKRAKDRVILKLISLHGLAYSEDESDDFRQPAGARNNDGSSDEDASKIRFLAACRKHIASSEDPATLRQWWTGDDQKRARRDFGLTQDEVDSLKTAFGDRLQQLAPRAVS